MEVIDVLGTRINNINLHECMQYISQAVQKRNELWIVTANPELIFKAKEDKELSSIIHSADLILPDGAGVLWAAKQFGHVIKERVTGIDLTYRILEKGNKLGWRIFLLGARPGIAERAMDEQHIRYPCVIFNCHHGYFTKEEESSVIEKIKVFKPDVLLVGLGSPRQEYWNWENRSLAKTIMGVGGTIDVLSGEVRRAPRVFQKYNIEWLYRLLKEPSRIKRQVILPLYIYEVLKHKRSRNIKNQQ